MPGSIFLNDGTLNTPEDLFLYGNEVYIADTVPAAETGETAAAGSGGRILVYNLETGDLRTLGEGVLVQPMGVFVNGDDATLKRVYYDGETVRLHPESYDPEYVDRVIDRSDPEAPELRVVGKAVSYTAPDGWRA